MSATRQDEDLGYAAVVEAVSQWPVSQRLHLMQHLLNTLDVDLNQHPNGAMRASEVEGLLAGPGAAPSDEDVRRLVADYLEEKYRKCASSLTSMSSWMCCIALNLQGADFEDDVQIACAQFSGLDGIVTRNMQHFKHAPCQILAPAELLTTLGESQAEPH